MTMSQSSPFISFLSCDLSFTCSINPHNTNKTNFTLWNRSKFRHCHDPFSFTFYYRMNREEKHRSGSITKAKKPGPRPTTCIWCNETDCKHCRCMGQIGCNHKKGEMCPNPRYKRRLVCNSCEKNKLREKQQLSALQSSKRKRPKSASKTSRKRVLPKVNQEKQPPTQDKPEATHPKDTERRSVMESMMG